MDTAILPLTPARWPDLERLFGPRGASGGCWCMWWRLSNREFEAGKGQGNRLALKSLVDAAEEPGLLAYVAQEPAGWCAIAPRAAYSRLARSRVLAPIDDQPVWSITCFFIAKQYRRQGLTGALIQAALDYARQRGASIVEAYPTEPRGGRAVDAFIYTGLASTFREVGFIEVARRSETRPIMRYVLRA